MAVEAEGRGDADDGCGDEDDTEEDALWRCADCAGCCGTDSEGDEGVGDDGSRDGEACAGDEAEAGAGPFAVGADA